MCVDSSACAARWRPHGMKDRTKMTSMEPQELDGPHRCVDELATGIRLIWALFYAADEEPQMRHETRENGGDQEATSTRQMIFYVVDDEPQMRHETRADVPIKK
ncbi:uncharacterized protein LOC144037364 isoform X1 [Vanacampus margaritifer]